MESEYSLRAGQSEELPIISFFSGTERFRWFILLQCSENGRIQLQYDAETADRIRNRQKNWINRTGGIELTGKNYDQIVEYILANQEKFYRLAYSYIKNQDGAMDAVQNAICRALEKSDSLRDINAVKTWFYRILVNECLMYIRKHEKEIPIDSGDWDGFGDRVYIESAFEPDDGISKMLDRLGSEVKTIILLYYFEELTLKEISEITQTNLNTVKSRLYSGLRKLKGIIKEDSD